jgi:hypothetical protein
MNDVEILARVKSDLRKGIEVLIVVIDDFYSANTRCELREIVKKYPQLSRILSPTIADAADGYDCGSDVYFVMMNGIVSVRIENIDLPVQFTIDIATFDLFCDKIIDMSIFATDGGATCLTQF